MFHIISEILEISIVEENFVYEINYFEERKIEIIIEILLDSDKADRHPK